jgi:hypothetical protein
MAFYADRLGSLDRVAIRERVVERFSAARMTDRYEELYARMARRGPEITAEITAALRARLAEVDAPDDLPDRDEALAGATPRPPVGDRA